MKLFLRTLLAAAAALTLVSTAFGMTDVAGSKDYPGLNRLQGYVITEYKELRFDALAFHVTEAGKTTDQSVEGRRVSYRFDWDAQSGAAQGPMPSALEVLRNYQNAVRSAGGRVLYEEGAGGDRATTLRIVKGDLEVWMSLHVIANGGVFHLDIIEKKAMQQEVTLDAAGMANSLRDAGSVTVSGIFFDTGKAELKPESEPALVEIAKLLVQSPALKLYVVGHTDMVADLDSNVKLSQARAQAVVAALVTKHGVAATRLVPAGVGPYAPVGSNRTDAGRAKNRRVELVEIATR